VDVRSRRGDEVGVEYNKLESFFLPRGEPNHPPMQWGFPPVSSSNPTLGLSDEQPKPICGWTTVECGFGIGKCGKSLKRPRSLFPRSSPAELSEKGFTKRNKCESDSMSEENSGR
jgi:hypothetical protein